MRFSDGIPALSKCGQLITCCSAIYIIFAPMFTRILAVAAFFALLIPFGNSGASAAYSPLNDTAGTVEQFKIDSIRRETIADSVISISKTFLGLPYKYGGNDPKTGFDCSHFVAYCYGKLGVALSGSSVAMSMQGTEISLNEVKKGDLMFFKGRSTNTTRVGHVALVIETGPNSIKMIHSTHRGVVIDEYYKMEYYKVRFLQARRISY
jgi:cell wall-associated NlpC family hydrolase